MTGDDSNPICLECGLCCNGVIFGDLQLQPGDNVARLQKLLGQWGTIARLKGNSKLPQPCVALEGCRCRIYDGRPQYCREFDCLLLKNVKSGRIALPAALGTIRTARQRAERVRRLLRQLGDADETAALGVRFRRIKKRAESGELDDEATDLFGELTLAVHDLNVIIGGSFYPG